MGKRYIAVALSLIIFLGLGLGLYVYSSIKSVPELFKLNEKLKDEGYYVAEFEFKMLGIVYYLDHGQYFTALSRLNQLHKQMESKEGLIKVPEFQDKKTKLDFYLNLQNSKTGAFMDNSYPIFTYIGCTLNMANYIDLLCRENGEPFHLKYPLKFFDQINTPEKLNPFLDDLSTVGWIGAKFRAPYVEIAELAEAVYSPGDIERLGLYSFTPEWKKALLQWFYANQDNQTGYWGAKLRNSGELLNSGDLNATEKVTAMFVDKEGMNRHADFPLRYKDKMFASTLLKLSEPMPEGIDQCHEWSLMINRGSRLLTRYLWENASFDSKNKAHKLMENIIRKKYETSFIEEAGAFSYNPEAQEPDLDGTGETLSYLDELGALSIKKQSQLWGPPEKNIRDLGIHQVSALRESDFKAVAQAPGINSIRFYKNDPGLEFGSNLVCIYYPKKTPVLDTMELLPKLNRWIKTTPQNMGNWVSKQSIKNELAAVEIKSVPAYKTDPPLNAANQVLAQKQVLVAVGFDTLQVPRLKASWQHNN
ncbi:MAG: hypothetical protein ABFD18_01835 [Syntrophomonas sp.]